MTHTENREIIIDKLREELFGPSSDNVDVYTSIDCSKDITLSSDDMYKLYRQIKSREEILQRDYPSKRYGVGVLYPNSSINLHQQSNDTVLQFDEDDLQDDKPFLDKNAQKSIKDIQANDQDLTSEEDYADISMANNYKQSSMGISFLLELTKDTKIIVRATGGRYHPKEVHIFENDFVKQWWCRTPISLDMIFTNDDIETEISKKTSSSLQPVAVNLSDFNLDISLYVRPYQNTGQNNSKQYLITACLINRNEGETNWNQNCLFQSMFRVMVEGTGHILPYPVKTMDDEESQSAELLYRNRMTYAIGHGCAANWEQIPNKSHVKMVFTDSLPVCEVSSITPDIYIDGRLVSIPLYKLTELNKENNGLDSLRP